MLNFKICQKCRNNFAKKSGDEQWADAPIIYVGGGCVVFPCPHPSEKLFIHIDSDPPEGCPYLTEHLVSQDVE